MKRAIAEDGTRTHEFTKTQKGSIRSALLVIEQAAFFHRDTHEGVALKSLAVQLGLLYVGETLVAESPPDAEEVGNDPKDDSA